MKAQALGIENFKKGLTAAVNVAEILIAIFKDFSLQTALSQLTKLLFDFAFYRGVIEKASEIWAEAKDTDTGEAYELYEHFKVEFDIENDDQEAKIEKALEFVPKLYEIVDRIGPALRQAVTPGLSASQRMIAVGKMLQIVGQSVEELGNFVDNVKPLIENPKADIPKLKAA